MNPTQDMSGARLGARQPLPQVDARSWSMSVWVCPSSLFAFRLSDVHCEAPSQLFSVGVGRHPRNSPIKKQLALQKRF